jgi:hypothetical protein
LGHCICWVSLHSISFHGNMSRTEHMPPMFLTFWCYELTPTMWLLQSLQTCQIKYG